MDDAPLWVFGYGSLVWNPGFPFQEQRLATLEDYARSFCMWSIHHRGTPEAPGLVLALDEHSGASCQGVGFSVAPDAREDALQYLRERELISSAYLERWVTLQLDDGRSVQAVAYVIDPGHEQYTGALSLERQAQVIAGAQGGRGPNCEYLWNTEAHLRELGIADADLAWLAERVRTLL
ncbi:MAG: gamma-glutamylcyclotransferase [Pseudomonadota bacterium]